MTRFFTALLLMSFLLPAAAATGKGKSLGSVADSSHGSSSAGGGGSGRRYVDPRKAPPLDETRKVSEQDCSKPVDLFGGNLRCK